MKYSVKESLDEALNNNRDQSNEISDLQSKLRRAHNIVQEREDDIAHQRIELQSRNDLIRVCSYIWL